MSLLLHRTTFGKPDHRGNVLTRDEANELLTNWVKNDRLRLHMRQVGYLMKKWSAEIEKLPEADQWRWELAGLLHDADWDQWPEQHCKKIIEELENRSIDPEIIRAIASHGPAHFGVDPETRMDHILFVLDELSGFMHAYSLMRPEGYKGMKVKGAKKKFKDKNFASGVNRDEVRDALERAKLDFDTVVTFIFTWQGDVTKP